MMTAAFVALVEVRFHPTHSYFLCITFLVIVGVGDPNEILDGGILPFIDCAGGTLHFLFSSKFFSMQSYLLLI